MAPRIVTGGRVLIRAARRPRIGEIWAYCDSEGRVVVHRCIGPARAGGWLFIGDAEGRADPPVPSSVLIGKIRAVDHGGRGRRVGTPDRLRGATRALRVRARSLLRAARARSLRRL